MSDHKKGGCKGKCDKCEPKKKCDKCKSKSKKKCHGTRIRSLPFVCDHPGIYYICDDLIYREVGAGITVQSDDVKIKGKFHKLSILLPGPASDTVWNPNVGVKVNGPVSGPNKYKNFKIKDLTITSLVDPANLTAHTFSVALFLQGVDHSTFENVVLTRTTHGLETRNVDGVRGVNSHFLNNYGFRSETNPFFAELFGSNVFQGEDSIDLRLEKCTFTGQATGERFDPLSFGIFGNSETERIRDVAVIDCDFNNSDSPIHNIQCKNLLVDRCNFYTDQTFYAPFQIGAFFADNVRVDNFQLLNSTVWAREVPGSGAALLFLVQGAGALVQNVTFNFNSSLNEIGGVIFVGNGPPTFTDAVFDNVVIAGSNEVGIVVLSDRTTVKNSSINVTVDPDVPNSGTSRAIVVGAFGVQSDNATIENNEITRTTPLVLGSIGVELDQTTGTVVKDNRIRNFCLGVGLFVTADANILQGNTITKNGVAIVDLGTNNIGTPTIPGSPVEDPNLIYNNSGPCNSDFVPMVKRDDKLKKLLF